MHGTSAAANNTMFNIDATIWYFSISHMIDMLDRYALKIGPFRGIFSYILQLPHDSGLCKQYIPGAVSRILCLQETSECQQLISCFITASGACCQGIHTCVLVQMIFIEGTVYHLLSRPCQSFYLFLLVFSDDEKQ